MQELRARGLQNSFSNIEKLENGDHTSNEKKDKIIKTQSRVKSVALLLFFLCIFMNIQRYALSATHREKYVPQPDKTIDMLPLQNVNNEKVPIRSNLLELDKAIIMPHRPRNRINSPVHNEKTQPKFKEPISNVMAQQQWYMKEKVYGKNATFGATMTNDLKPPKKEREAIVDHVPRFLKSFRQDKWLAGCETIRTTWGHDQVCCRKEGKEPEEFTCFPSLVVIGAQKGGTTALHSYLMLHPSLSPAIRKELHVFDNKKNMEEYPKRIAKDYRAKPKEYFQEHVTFETTPSYIASPLACQRMSQKLPPTSKFVMIVRNPIERLWSEMSMKNRRIVNQKKVREILKSESFIIYKCLQRLRAEEGNRQGNTLLFLMSCLRRSKSNAVKEPKAKVAFRRMVVAMSSKKNFFEICFPNRIIDDKRCYAAIGALRETPPNYEKILEEEKDFYLSECLNDGSLKILDFISQNSGTVLKEYNGFCLAGSLIRTCKKVCYGVPETACYVECAFNNTIASDVVDKAQHSCLRKNAAKDFERERRSGTLFAREMHRFGKQIASTISTAESRLSAKEVKNPTKYEKLFHMSSAVKNGLNSQKNKITPSDLLNCDGPYCNCFPDAKMISDISKNFLFRGMYYIQMKHCLRFIPKNRILVVTNSELRNQPSNTLNKIVNFVGLPHFDYSNITYQQAKKVFDKVYPNFEVQTGWSPDGTSSSKMPDYALEIAEQVYKMETKRFSKLMGVEF